MICAWQCLLQILPSEIRNSVDLLGKDSLQEIRLRIGERPELRLQDGETWLPQPTTPSDISFVINAASKYSPWAATTIRRGYLTAPGGHRIGLCGDAVIQNGEMTGLRNPYSLCIRVARDFPGIGNKVKNITDSILIVGRPGSGKTTLLRDIIRAHSDKGPGSVGVVDERGEVFPVFDQSYCFPCGKRTDVITGCSKAHGIDILIRTMGPSWIAVDEITAEEDCKAIMNAGWSGVSILATAHAGSLDDLNSRPIYRPIINSGLFRDIIIMHDDKSWHHQKV